MNPTVLGLIPFQMMIRPNLRKPAVCCQYLVPFVLEKKDKMNTILSVLVCQLIPQGRISEKQEIGLKFPRRQDKIWYFLMIQIFFIIFSQSTDTDDLISI